jgi:hypothetical protein
MKVDKQALKKHHFWILLGVFGFFAFLLILLVPILVGSEIEDKEKKLDEVEKDLKSNSSPITDAHTKVQKKQISTLEDRRDSLWREMFKAQQNILVLPTALQERVKGLKFGDEIEKDLVSKFRDPSIYLASYEQIVPTIKPTEYKGSWDAVLQPIAWNMSILPSSEEVWLSVEDLCVRREVLRVIREANMITARFSREAYGASDKPAVSNIGKEFSQRFVSRWYQIDLVVNSRGRGTYGFSGKVKNLSGKRRRIGELSLNVWLSPEADNREVRPAEVNFSLEDLAASGERAERDLPEVIVRLNQAPQSIFRVELRHTLQTVPVRRLDEIAFGLSAAGHRAADRKILQAKFSKSEKSSGTGTGASVMPGAPGGGGGMVAAGPPGAGGAGMSGGGAGGDEKTTNGVAKNRYVDVTDQVRRIPLAVVLIADQSCMQDVVTAFSNSAKMRFQIMQYGWRRVYLPASTTSSEPAPMGGAATGPMGGAAGPMGGMAGPMGGGAGGPMGGIAGPMGGTGSPMGGAAFGPMGGGAGGPVGGGAGRAGANHPSYADQPPVNLVEMTIYGIANMYEEPPPAKTTDNASPPPAAPPAVVPAKPPEKPMSTPPATPPEQPKATTPATPVDVKPMSPPPAKTPEAAPGKPGPAAADPKPAPAKPPPKDAPKP